MSPELKIQHNFPSVFNYFITIIKGKKENYWKSTMRGLKKLPRTLDIVDTFFPEFFFRECAKKIFYILSMKFPHASWNHFDCVHEGICYCF